MSAGAGLSYLLAYPATISVSVRSPGALLLLALLPVVVMLGRRGLARSWLALGARAAAFVLVVLTSAGVALSTRLPTDRLSLMAAVDVSESPMKGMFWMKRRRGSL